MNISFLKHNCSEGSFANMLQTFLGNTPVEQCPFYWKMRGGKSYYGSIHYFTFFGFRIVINLLIKKSKFGSIDKI